MRDFAHHCLLGYFVLGSRNQDATTDIDGKYVKRRGSAQGCAFWGSQNQNLTSTPPSPKTAILGPDLDGTKNCRPKKQL